MLGFDNFSSFDNYFTGDPTSHNTLPDVCNTSSAYLQIFDILHLIQKIFLSCHCLIYPGTQQSYYILIYYLSLKNHL